jgi:hypothetical protein
MRLFRFGLLFAGAVTGALAVAGPREEVLARAAHCASIVDDAAWLACYRAAAAPMESALAAAGNQASAASSPSPPVPMPRPVPVPVPVPAPAPAPPAPQVAAARFGIAADAPSNALVAPAEQLHPAPQTATTDHITAHVIRYSLSTQKYFTLVLDNGQVWQQINGDDDFAVLSGPAQRYEVTIRHGLFGSYNLTITGIAGLFRVRRIT